MKILFVWTGVTSYMADCWRKLQQEPGVELKVVVEQVTSGKDFDAARVLQGLDYTLVQTSQTSQTSQTFSPDVIFAVGWHSKLVRAVVSDPALKGVPKICCSDMPWRWKPRCIAARFVLGRYLRQFRGMMVPGESGFRYARWLGFPKERIHKGMYGIDTERFGGSEGKKGFLYLGRFAPEKRIDLLAKAYARYRELGGTWPFDLYGSGTLPNLSNLSNPSNFSNLFRVHPFVQPDEVPGLHASHSCLVLASDFDPWPLVVLESCASGRPIIVTDRCTNHYELVRENGLVVRHGDAEALARAMLRMEREPESFDGDAGRRLAAEYSCQAWCKRIVRICESL